MPLQARSCLLTTVRLSISLLSHFWFPYLKRVRGISGDGSVKSISSIWRSLSNMGIIFDWCSRKYKKNCLGETLYRYVLIIRKWWPSMDPSATWLLHTQARPMPIGWSRWSNSSISMRIFWWPFHQKSKVYINDCL